MRMLGAMRLKLGAIETLRVRARVFGAVHRVVVLEFVYSSCFPTVWHLQLLLYIIAVNVVRAFVFPQVPTYYLCSYPSLPLQNLPWLLEEEAAATVPALMMVHALTAMFPPNSTAST